MEQYRRLLGAACVALVCSLGCAGTVYMADAPPPPQVEVKPAFPGGSAIWIEGHWGLRHGAYYWVPGYWEMSPRGVWVPGHWDRRPRGHVWVPGHWRR